MLTLQVRLTKELVQKAQDLVDKGLYSNKSEVIRDSLRRLAFEDNLKTSKERTFNVLYTSDIHGNLVQYHKLFKRAEETHIDAIIIGGDITPKDFQHRTIEAQRKFLQQQLFPLIQEFKKNNATTIFIMIGNDDFKPNEILIKKQTKLFQSINKRVVRFHEDFKIAGYSFVPLTPFKYKDWEKLDTNKEDERATRKNILTNGIKTKGERFVNFSFDLRNRKDTMENDLNRLFKNIIPEKTILVSHSPPYNTSLDLLKNKEHVGSIAIRKVIEQKQPCITLHGHIHETVEASNKFMEKIGKTIAISSGNDHLTNTLALIEFNLYKPEEAKRLLI